MLFETRISKTRLTFACKNLADIGLIRFRFRKVWAFDDIDLQLKHDEDDYRAAWGNDPGNFIWRLHVLQHIKKLFDGCAFMEAAPTRLH